MPSYGIYTREKRELFTAATVTMRLLDPYLFTQRRRVLLQAVGMEGLWSGSRIHVFNLKTLTFLFCFFFLFLLESRERFPHFG